MRHAECATKTPIAGIEGGEIVAQGKLFEIKKVQELLKEQHG